MCVARILLNGSVQTIQWISALMKYFVRPAAILFFVGQLLSFSATASSISAVEALNQFNLIVFENSVSSSHVDGRSLIGGNLTGGDYV